MAGAWAGGCVSRQVARMSSDARPFLCPCCQCSVARPTPAQIIVGLGLTKMQAAILDALLNRPGTAVSTATILRAMYGGDDDPPDAARQYRTLKETISVIRKPLREIGLNVISAGYGQGWMAIWDQDAAYLSLSRAVRIIQ